MSSLAYEFGEGRSIEMGPRILDVTMTDQDYEALRKKLLETYSVRPTLSNPMVKRLVDWHCLESSCFLDNMVFDKREKWIRHHQRFHKRMCMSDRGYPKEAEAKQFIQEHDRRENARHIAGAGGSARLMPPTATPAGPHSRISGDLRVIPLNSAPPSSSTSGALRGASPIGAAPNSPRSGALLRNSTAHWRRGPRGPYRPRANKAARRQEHPDHGPESSTTLDAAGRERLMQQLSYNLQAVSRISADSVRIMQTLGLASTNRAPDIRRPGGSKRPRESPNAGARRHPTTAVAPPVPLPTWVDRRALASTSQRPRGLQAGQAKFVGAASQAPAAHLNVGRPTPAFEATPYPSQALALPIAGPIAPSYGSAGPLPVEAPAQLALTHMTPSQPEEEEGEENHIAASYSESSDSGSGDEFIYQDTDVPEDNSEGQVNWNDVKVQMHASGSWP